ncbi:MAG: hypothetical protein HY365_03905 [Candidatus Aenigmarchaeota archaeon]|nr:hypothetical protein [Candidatus Aenigmarchaeota archaeon]
MTDISRCGGKFVLKKKENSSEVIVDMEKLVKLIDILIKKGIITEQDLE